MNGAELYPESSRSLDSLRHMRLMALLRDMIDDGGKVQTAAALGVNYRTLVPHEETGRLTDRMADALERHLLLGAGSAAAQQRDRVDAARGAAAGAVGGGKERVRDALSDRSRD